MKLSNVSNTYEKQSKYIEACSACKAGVLRLFLSSELNEVFFLVRVFKVLVLAECILKYLFTARSEKETFLLFKSLINT